MKRAVVIVLAGMACGGLGPAGRAQVADRSASASSGGLCGLGDVALLNGKVKGAEKVYSRCREMARKEGNKWVFMRCSLGLGKAARNLHKTGLAGKAFRDALKAAKELAARGKDDGSAQEALLEAGKQFGGFSLVNGMPSEAVAAYATAREAAMALSKSDARAAQWLHEALVCSHRIGDIQMNSGGEEQATAAYHKGLAAAREMVRLEPGVARWKMDLARSLAKVAVAGDGPVKNLQKALGILQDMEKKGQSVPGLRFWRERLAAALERARKRKGR